MEASTWLRSGNLLDDEGKMRRRDSPVSRNTSKMKCDDSILLSKKQVAHEGLGLRKERGEPTDPRCDVHVSTKKLQISRRACARRTRRLMSEESCSEEQTVAKAGGKGTDGEVPSQVFEMHFGQRHLGEEAESRKANAIVYRLEETEFSIASQEGKIHPFVHMETEGKKEITEYKLPLIQRSASHQESYQRTEQDARVSVNMINTFQGTLKKQISRSDSESSIESRQVNKLTLNSPLEENKPGFQNVPDNRERKSMVMDSTLQNEEDAAVQSASCALWEGCDAGGNYRQTVNLASLSASSTDWYPDGWMGEKDLASRSEKDKQVAKSLEITISAIANCAGVTEASRGNDSQIPSPGNGEDLRIETDSPVSDSKSRQISTKAPLTEIQSEGLAVSLRESVAMSEMLRTTDYDRTLASKHQQEATFPGSATQISREKLPPGDPAQEEQKGEETQRDEKVLKVADVKKTFEKKKPAEDKASASTHSPARKDSRSLCPMGPLTAVNEKGRENKRIQNRLLNQHADFTCDMSREILQE